MVAAPRGAGGFGYDPYFLLPGPRTHGGRARAGGEERGQPPRQGAAAADRAAAGTGLTTPSFLPCLARRRYGRCSIIGPRPDRHVQHDRPVPRRKPPAPPRRVARRSRSTSTSPGACGSARTATSTRTRRAGELPEDAYVDALIADLERALPDVWGRRVHSVFFGGGTPSLFSARVDRPAARRDPRTPAARSRTARSRWKRIPARSRPRSSATFAQPG